MMNSPIHHDTPARTRKNLQLDDEEGEPSGARAADKPAGAKPPAALLGSIDTDFFRSFLCCLVLLPIQCADKPE